MDRRSFLHAGVALSAATALPGRGSAQPDFDGPSAGWRTFEVTSRIEILKPECVTQAWLPLPCVDAPAWVRNRGDFWTGNSDSVKVVRDKKYGAEFLRAQWSATETAPTLEVISRVSTRDRMTDFSTPSNPARLKRQLRTLYTASTALIPADGIVRETAAGIVKGAEIDVDKARAMSMAFVLPIRGWATRAWDEAGTFRKHSIAALKCG